VRRLTEGDDKCEDGPVLRALKWLARRQAADGSWPGGIDATSVALLAFLGYEDGPASAGFSNSVRRAVDRLLAIQGADGRFGATPDAHARATLAINKAYTASGNRTLEPALRRATSILAADMEAATPPSVWMVQALKAVDSNRLAEDGLQPIVSRTTGQLRKSQDSYAAVALGVLEAKPEGGTASSTAAPRRNEALRGAASGGRAAAEASLEITDGDSADRLFFLTQQKLLAGDTNGAARSRDVLTPLIGRQNEDGSWPADTNQVYVTAMGALIAEAHGRKR
jgi:squalene cyclase